MNDSLVVLKQGILLLGKGIRLYCDLQFMGWLKLGPQVYFLALMDSLNQIEICIPSLCCLTRQRKSSCCFFDIRVSQDKLVEAVLDLSLIFRSMEVLRIEADSVLGATGGKLIRLVENSS